MSLERKTSFGIGVCLSFLLLIFPSNAQGENSLIAFPKMAFEGDMVTVVGFRGTQVKSVQIDNKNVPYKDIGSPMQMKDMKIQGENVEAIEILVATKPADDQSSKDEKTRTATITVETDLKTFKGQFQLAFRRLFVSPKNVTRGEKISVTGIAVSEIKAVQIDGEVTSFVEVKPPKGAAGKALEVVIEEQIEGATKIRWITVTTEKGSFHGQFMQLAYRKLAVSPKKVFKGDKITVTEIAANEIKAVQIDGKDSNFVEILSPEGMKGKAIEVVINDAIAVATEERRITVTTEKGSFHGQFMQLAFKRLVVSPEKIFRGDKITVVGIVGKEIKTVRVDTIDTPFTEIEPPKGKKGKALEFVIGDDIAGKVQKRKISVTTEEGLFEGEFSQYSRRRFWNFGVFGPFLIVILILIGFFKIYGDRVFRSKTGQLSLSKIQMSVWTIVFGLSYLLLALFWGRFLDITQGMFWLMGISAATAVGAKGIVVRNQSVSTFAQNVSREAVEAYKKCKKASNISDAKNHAQTTLDKANEINQLLPNHPLAQPIAAAKKVIQNQKPTLSSIIGAARRLAHATVKVAPPPSRLFSDLDEDSLDYVLSLHRCQIALWSAVVVLMFLVQLFDSMHLPEIPNNLLVLMGISGGTYLGFNFPKQPK
jgi:hypothetical protein